MISVAQAHAAIFALCAPVGTETVPLRRASGRVLRADAIARMTQPPFSASAMDGYAIRRADLAVGAEFRVVGEAAAGHGFDGQIGAMEGVRIFTGAPLPQGADYVVIQEDTTRNGDHITIRAGHDTAPYVRAAGQDFTQGDTMGAPRILRPADIALLAAMNVDTVTVARPVRVAVLSTGDELVMPGETPGPDQIIASNALGLAAMIEELGAQAQLLPIAHDTSASLRAAFALAQGADLVVSIGGASVGDHDLIGDITAELGMERAFYKVRMRPGKPLMAGRMKDGAVMLGLPGNPVSAMVCGRVFMAPMIRAMQGLAARAPRPDMAPLAHDIGANGPRAHYMRARLKNGAVHIHPRQDSALLSVLAEADCLAIRAPDEGPRKAGEMIPILSL